VFERSDEPETMFVIDQAPHNWLVPRLVWQLSIQRGDRPYWPFIGRGTGGTGRQLEKRVSAMPVGGTVQHHRRLPKQLPRLPPGKAALVALGPFIL